MPLQEKRLDSPARRLVLVQGLFNLGQNLAGLFVGVFIWRLGKSIPRLGEFHFAMFATIIPVFLLAAWVARRRGSAVVLTAGLGLFTAFYLSLLLAGERAAGWLAWFGVLQGCGISFFWAAVHNLSYELTHDRNRDYYYGLVGVAQTAVAIVGPLVSGAIVSSRPGLLGFQIVFGLSVVLFACTAVVAARIRGGEAPGEFRLLAVLTGPGGAAFGRPMVTYFFLGLREGLFWFMTGILLFLAVGDERLYSYWIVGLSALAAAGFYLAARFVRPENRKQVLFWGGLAHFVITVPLFFSLEPTAVLFYATCSFVTFAAWSVAVPPLVFKLIGQAPALQGLRAECIAAREIPMGLGRLVSLGAFLLLARELPVNAILHWLLPLLNGTVLVAWLILRRV